MVSILRDELHTALADGTRKSSANAEPRKTGYLQKQGGQEGGHKNWKRRFFVLHSSTLAYYSSEDEFRRDNTPKGIIVLDAYYATRSEDDRNFEFVIHAYPKSMYLRAANEEERDEWIRALLSPVYDDGTDPETS